MLHYVILKLEGLTDLVDVRIAADEYGRRFGLVLDLLQPICNSIGNGHLGKCVELAVLDM